MFRWLKRLVAPVAAQVSDTADLERLIEQVCHEAPIRHGDPFDGMVGACQTVEVWRYDFTFIMSDEAIARLHSRRVEEIYKRLEPWGA